MWPFPDLVPSVKLSFTSEQGFSAATTVTFGGQIILSCGEGLSCDCGVFSSPPRLSPLDASSTHCPPHDGHKCFQILPSTPGAGWGGGAKESRHNTTSGLPGQRTWVSGGWVF